LERWSCWFDDTVCNTRWYHTKSIEQN
jgi:hypothetical protein